MKNMFQHLERELIEGEPWASEIVYLPVWKMADEEPKELQRINYELTAKPKSIDFTQFYLTVIKVLF